MRRLAAGFWLAAMASAAYGNIAPTVLKGHPVVGTWRFVLPGTGCVETYRIRENGTMRITSGEEVAEAAFDVAAMPSFNGFYKFSNTTTQDNGERDCAGQVTPTGRAPDLFIRFHQDGDTMILCRREALDACFGPMKRVRE